MSLSLVAATASQPARPAQQQQQQHSTSGQSPPGQGAAGSRLATVETGADDDAAGGSVDMTAPASRRQQHQPALSAPLPAPGAASAEGGGAAGGPGPAAHPAVSAPMVLPGQQQQPEQPQPAMSVSLSAHREGAGGPPGELCTLCAAGAWWSTSLEGGVAFGRPGAALHHRGCSASRSAQHRVVLCTLRAGNGWLHGVYARHTASHVRTRTHIHVNPTPPAGQTRHTCVAATPPCRPLCREQPRGSPGAEQRVCVQAPPAAQRLGGARHLAAAARPVAR